MVSECFHVLKTWLEVSRVKLYRNNLEGNKNYWFKLSRARVTKGKITVNILRKSWGKHGHCKEEQPFELRGFVQNLKRTSWPNCHFPTIDDLLDGLSPFKIIIWKTPRMPIFYREFSSAFCRALCHYYIFIHSRLLICELLFLSRNLIFTLSWGWGICSQLTYVPCCVFL